MKTLQIVFALLFSLLTFSCSEQKESKLTLQNITGDWRYTYDGFVYHARFHSNGLFAFKSNGTFSISNDTLHFQHVKYYRQGGNGNSLVGAWREDYPSDSTSYIINLNADSSYYYHWTKDGANGDGYYVLDGNKLSLVETYGYFYCIGDSVFQIGLNGNKFSGKYVIQDTVMTVTSASGEQIYYKDPLYPVNESLLKRKRKAHKLVSVPD